MTVQRILAATDFSTRSERALKRAAMLSRQFSAALQIVHVVDDDQPAERVREDCERAAALLKSKAAELGPQAGSEPETLVRKGDPFQGIVAAATDEKVDLVTMGAHRKNILRDIFIGTTIERVIRTGPHPVLMANREPKSSYARVIVATDMSGPSADALRAAKELGLLHGVQLTLVHAFESMTEGKMLYAGVRPEKVERHVAQEAAEAGRELQEFLAEQQVGDLLFDIRVEEGPTFHVIKSIVDKDRPDLLVIGTRGLTGAKRILLGSEADAMLRGLDCDILAVPARRSRPSV